MAGHISRSTLPKMVIFAKIHRRRKIDPPAKASIFLQRIDQNSTRLAKASILLQKTDQHTLFNFLTLSFSTGLAKASMLFQKTDLICKNGKGVYIVPKK